MSEQNHNNTNDRPSDSDKVLDLTVRQCLAENQPEATSFDPLWQAAQSEANQVKTKSAASPHWSWLPISAAAAVFLSFIVFHSPDERPDIPMPTPTLSEHIEMDNKLFHQLISTTAWTAPSDHLLKRQPGLKVWGVPKLNIQPAEEIL